MLGNVYQNMHSSIKFNHNFQIWTDGELADRPLVINCGNIALAYAIGGDEAYLVWVGSPAQIIAISIRYWMLLIFNMQTYVYKVSEQNAQIS